MRSSVSALEALLRVGCAAVIGISIFSFSGPGCTSEASPKVHPHLAPGRYADAEKWARSFESSERDAWQKPDQVVAALNVAEDAKIADVGAGTGYFAVRLAKVAKKGTVYAIDLEPNMVAYVDERARREKLPNVKGVVATVDDPKIPEPVDLVLLVDTYHHIEERPAYFARVARSLREGGRIAIVDFKKGSAIGPPEDHKFSAEQVEKEMRAAGFEVTERHDFLPHQYLLVFDEAKPPPKNQEK